MSQNTVSVTQAGGTQNAHYDSHTAVEVIAAFGLADINERLQMFFAELATDAGMSLEELMERSRASRKVNEAKRAYQAKGVAEEGGLFVYGTNENVTDVWIATYTSVVDGKHVPKENPEGYTGYTQEDVDKMLAIHSSMESDHKLSGEEKESLDNIMDRSFSVDGQGRAVISDEMMTMTLQQANGLYQSMINGNRAMISAQIDLLRELIRALGG